ncbi:hypothetical protein TrVFT333_011017 [Trichoderma virens FT-333]|nr:hypothetical protein TrVFT333_011017 [Trichoderma virens FT-333]
MSEDDIDLAGHDGQGPGRVDRDRRAPRFSWTPAYEATFFRSLCESVQLGMRENSSFKAEAWERAAQALQEHHGAYPAKSHLINKSDNARKRFRLWRGLREDPDFIYNPVTRTVTATEEAWRAHIEPSPHKSSQNQAPAASSSATTGAQQRPTTAPSLPRNLTAGQASALTPPEESVPQGRKRPSPMGSLQSAGDLAQSTSGPAIPQSALPTSPEKRRRLSSRDEATSSTSAATPLLGSSALPATGTRSTLEPRSRPESQVAAIHSILEELVSLSKASRALSYADAAAKGARQTPEEAAAPQQPEIIPSESASTASLIDVDMPSVHTVRSDFLEQDIQTETQAERIRREEEAARANQAAKKKAAGKARKADSWVTRQFSQLSDGSVTAIAIANFFGVVGVSGFLGYRAWGLYEKSRLDWKHVGVGFGVLAAVGAVEAVLGRYLYKSKERDSS